MNLEELSQLIIDLEFKELQGIKKHVVQIEIKQTDAVILQIILNAKKGDQVFQAKLLQNIFREGLLAYAIPLREILKKGGKSEHTS